MEQRAQDLKTTVQQGFTESYDDLLGVNLHKRKVRSEEDAGNKAAREAKQDADLAIAAEKKVVREAKQAFNVSKAAGIDWGRLVNTGRLLQQTVETLKM